MGLFGSQEKLNLGASKQVDIADHVGAQLPDIGEYFLDLLPAGADEVAPHVDALRGANGWIPTGALAQFGIMKYSNGPLTILNTMVTRDPIKIEVWASLGLRGREKREVENAVSEVLREQGHAAAATWAIIARPQAHLYVEDLAAMLIAGWDESVSFVRNDDVIKAFKKWKRA